MDKNIQYSESLGQKYEIKPDGAIKFEDGITYDPSEYNNIKTRDPSKLRNIHLIKKVFGGIITMNIKTKH